MDARAQGFPAACWEWVAPDRTAIAPLRSPEAAAAHSGPREGRGRAGAARGRLRGRTTPAPPDAVRNEFRLNTVQKKERVSVSFGILDSLGRESLVLRTLWMTLICATGLLAQVGAKTETTVPEWRRSALKLTEQINLLFKTTKGQAFPEVTAEVFTYGGATSPTSEVMRRFA